MVSSPGRDVGREPAVGGFDASWANRLIDRIAAFPGPAWAAYLAVFVVVLVVAHLVSWLDGAAPFGVPDAYRASFAMYLVGPIAAIAYFDSVARTALDRFRPALGPKADLIEGFEFELATMPAKPTNLWTLAGLAFAAMFVAVGPDPAALMATAPLTFAFDVTVGLASFAGAAVLLYHTLRQLREISRIHEQATALDLYRPDPLYAFSSLTAQTGIALIGINYVSAATDPATFSNPALMAGLGLSLLIAIGCFVLPLMGMHRRLVAEKVKLEADAGDLLRRTIDELDRRIRADDDSGASAMTRVLEGIVIRRDVIGRIPTWPWRAGTLRAFVSAVVLPLAMWLLFRTLGKVLG